MRKEERVLIKITLILMETPNKNPKLINIRELVSRPLADKNIINNKPQKPCKICGKELSPYLIPVGYSHSKWLVDENCEECFEIYKKISEEIEDGWENFKLSKTTFFDPGCCLLELEIVDYSDDDTRKWRNEFREKIITEWEQKNGKKLSQNWNEAKEPFKANYDAETLVENLYDKLTKMIPKRYWGAAFFLCPLEIKNYYLEKQYEKKGLYVFGKSGTGKTYSAYSLTKYLVAEDCEVQIYNLPKLLNVIRATFKKDSIYDESTDDNYHTYIRDMKDVEALENVQILIIDDIGAEKPTDWVMETLYQLINERCSNCKTTVFTSNLSLDELAERLGDRISSRIVQMCDVIEITGEDKRIKNS